MSKLASPTFRHAGQACTTLARYTPSSLAYMARTYTTTASGKDSAHMWLPVGRDAIILQRAREALESLSRITPMPTRHTQNKFDSRTMSTDDNATGPFKETETFFFTSEHVSSNCSLATLRSDFPHCVLISFCGSDPVVHGSASQSGETVHNTTYVLIAGHDEIRRAAKILLRQKYTIADRTVIDGTDSPGSERRILVPVPKVDVTEDQLPSAVIQPGKPLGLVDLEDMWTDEKASNKPRAPKREETRSTKLEKQPIYMADDEILDMALWSLRSNSDCLMQLMK